MSDCKHLEDPFGNCPGCAKHAALVEAARELTDTLKADFCLSDLRPEERDLIDAVEALTTEAPADGMCARPECDMPVYSADHIFCSGICESVHNRAPCMCERKAKGRWDGQHLPVCPIYTTHATEAPTTASYKRVTDERTGEVLLVNTEAPADDREGNS